MAERRSLSVSPNVSPSMVIPKREPIENDFIQNNKRRFGEHLSHDTDSNVLNKRQMATKKHQYSDNIQTKSNNGRNVNNDEQQQKQIESHSPSNNQKLFSNGGNIDSPSSSSSSSSSSNVQAKPR